MPTGVIYQGNATPSIYRDNDTRKPKNPKRNPDGAKMKAQDQYLKQRQTRNERASNFGKKKINKKGMQNVALIRFISAGIKIISHAEKKTRKVIKKRQ